MSAPSWLNPVIQAGLNALKPVPATMILITAEQLSRCAKSMSKDRAQILASLINELCPSYGIKTKDVLHEFLANVMHESMEFQLRVENMNYRATTIVKTWPSRFAMPNSIGVVPAGKLDATKYAKNPRGLANVTYGTRMGNRPGTDDGWNLRGSGFIGLTGYYIMEAFRKFKGFVTVEDAASYARNSDRGGLESALWYFCVLKDLIDEADRDEMIGIVKEINGGTIGLKDRLYYYDLVKKNVT